VGGHSPNCSLRIADAAQKKTPIRNRGFIGVARTRGRKENR
jgi:hypothetical protein